MIKNVASHNSKWHDRELKGETDYCDKIKIPGIGFIPLRI